MARKKRKVTHYQEAVARLAGLRSIDAELSLADGVGIGEYQKAIDDLALALDAYNQALSKVDEAMLIADAKEQVLRDLSERMLAGVAAKYGKNSEQYVMAGGTKKSLIVRGPSGSTDGGTPPDESPDGTGTVVETQ